MKDYREFADKFCKDVEKRVSVGSSQLDVCALTGIVTRNGEVMVSDNQACHAGLSGMSIRNGSETAIVVSIIVDCHDHKPMNSEWSVPYLDWLFNRSPYASVFLDKDAQECLEKKRICCTPDVPANLLVGGLIASRRLTEYGDILRSWYELMSRGVNENMAYLLSHNLHLDNRDYKTDSSVGLTVRSCHCSLNPGCMDEKAVFNFINSKVVHSRDTFAQGSSYHGVDKTWGESEEGSFLHNWMRTLNFSKKADGKSLNPFPEPVRERRVGQFKAVNFYNVLSEEVKNKFGLLEQA